MATKKPEIKPWTKKEKILFTLFVVFLIITIPFWVGVMKLIIYGAAYSVVVNPYLLFIYIPFIFVAFSKRLRDKSKKLILNLFKNLYKLIQKLNKKSRFLVPENILARLSLNIGFIFVWFYFITSVLYDFFWVNNNKVLNQFFWNLYQSPFFNIIVWTLVLGPILFITQLFWLENGFRVIRGTANTFIKAGLTKKDIKRRVKSTANYLSESRKVLSKSRRVKSNISEADELKKYAELRDQGIITEEEFQDKKKILLDL